MEKTGFFEGSAGNKSSSRLNSSIIIWVALLLSTVMILSICAIAIKNQTTEGMIGSLTGVGAFFTTVSGGAMLFMFNQKKLEVSGGTRK